MNIDIRHHLIEHIGHFIYVILQSGRLAHRQAGERERRQQRAGHEHQHHAEDRYDNAAQRDGDRDRARALHQPSVLRHTRRVRGVSTKKSGPGRLYTMQTGHPTKAH